MEGKGEKVAPESSNRATPPPIALHTLQRTTVAAATRSKKTPRPTAVERPAKSSGRLTNFETVILVFSSSPSSSPSAAAGQAHGTQAQRFFSSADGQSEQAKLEVLMAGQLGVYGPTRIQKVELSRLPFLETPSDPLDFSKFELIFSTFSILTEDKN
jgi:hypothetical protein